MLGKVNSGIDRARRVLPGTRVGLIGTSSRANPDKKYWDFHGFLRYLAFWEGKGGLLGKVNSGIDRTRRVLLGTSVGLIGTSSWANPDKKYSNSELRYPTYKKNTSVSLDINQDRCYHFLSMFLENNEDCIQDNSLLLFLDLSRLSNVNWKSS